MKALCTEAEWMILELLWQNGPRSAEEMAHVLENSIGWTQHAVNMLLKRMQEKHTISVQQTQPDMRYIASVTQAETVIAPMKRLRPWSPARRKVHENSHRV